jgi:hypothetical protein
MKALRFFLLIAIVVTALMAVGPAPASAADYWNGYWGWYDSTYVPYYQRYYSYSPTYAGPTYSAPGYGYYTPPTYGYSSYYGPTYAAPYGGAYYGLPRAGVGAYPGGTAVRVGPLGLGWR